MLRAICLVSNSSVSPFSVTFVHLDPPRNHDKSAGHGCHRYRNRPMVPNPREMGLVSHVSKQETRRSVRLQFTTLVNSFTAAFRRNRIPSYELASNSRPNMASSLPVRLIPWDPDSKDHIDHITRQRISCGWDADKVQKWKVTQRSGHKCLFWIVRHVGFTDVTGPI